MFTCESLAAELATLLGGTAFFFSSKNELLFSVGFSAQPRALSFKF